MTYKSLCLTFLTLTIFAFAAHAKTKNGFNLDNASIPVRDILSGGPPRDGIPALNQPIFVAVKDAVFMNDKDRLLGVVINGEARAYPIRILNHHELVNDKVANQAIVVSYCPLCGTGMVFDANVVDGKALQFGVSGLLYNSDVLLYDRNTESLWSQIMKRAVSGKLEGQTLRQIPALHTNFAEWKKKHPDSKVMSTDTGYGRNYSKSPYQAYERTRRLWFKVSHKAPKSYHPKESVLGIEINGEFKAYPFIELSKHGHSSFTDQVGGRKLTIFWNQESKTAYAENQQGEVLASTIGFWFAWFTFHPETSLFTASEQTSTFLKD